MDVEGFPAGGLSVPTDELPDALAALERVVVDGSVVRAAVAFVTVEGVKALSRVLEPRSGVSIELVARAADVTMPQALTMLADDLGAAVSVVIGRHASAFHPKLWLVEHGDVLTVLSGSGNLTSAGLRGNDEQFELYDLPAHGAAADAHAERFERLTAHALPLETMLGSAIWREWLDVIRAQATYRRQLAQVAKNLAERDPQPDRSADKAALLADLQDLYERTRAARLPREDGVAYVPSRFGQALGRARDGNGDPVRIVTNMCRQRSRGFDVLFEHRRRDLTVEQLVLDATKPYHDLFGATTRELCAERLRGFGTDDEEPDPEAGDAPFFGQSEDLSQGQLVPLIIDAALSLQHRPTRDELVTEAIRLGRFTQAELAVSSHRKNESERGWGAVEGRLQYAVWDARQQDALLIGEVDGRQTLTAAGAARRGEQTGYGVLDHRRLPV